MDILNLYGWVTFEIFPQPRNKNIKTAAGEIVVITPNLHQQFIPFYDRVGILAKGCQKLCFAVGKLFLFVGAVQNMITDIKNKMPQLALSRKLFRFFAQATPS